jgi:hypothetical protein
MDVGQIKDQIIVNADGGVLFMRLPYAFPVKRAECARAVLY